MQKIINRYILREISYPFLLILFVLTFVLIMGKIVQIMDLMVNKGIGFTDVMKLFFMLFPSFLVFTIPMSLLVSILIGLGRLSADNEITVFKASGLSLYQLLTPIAIASIVAFSMTIITTLFLVPQSKFAMKNLIFNIAKKKASVGIKEKTFNDEFKDILLYAEIIPVQGNYMEGVVVSDTRISNEPITIIAKKAYLVSDPNRMSLKLRLEDGSTHTVDTKHKNYRKMDFKVYDLNLFLESAISEEKKVRTKTGAEMTVWEISQRLKSGMLSKEETRQLSIELNKSTAIPFSCLIMGIIAVPLSIRAHRAAKARGFSIGIIIVLIYYFLLLTGESFIETKDIPAFIGIWAPNIIFGVIGIYLFVLAAKDKAIEFPFLRDYLKSLFSKVKGKK